MRIFLILLLLLFSAAFTNAQTVTERNIQPGKLPTPFKPGQKVRVAFLGGSITEMDGFRPMVCENLKKRFPQTEFDFVAAGIGSTCSMTGAARLERDILSKGPIDLFFVEFAVNDDQDAAHSEEQAIRGMEGIVRHFWKANPNGDIVMIFFANEHLIDSYKKGAEALSITAHRKVADHYGIPTINVAKEVQQQIDEGHLTWKQYGGVHPAPHGNRIAANMIEKLYDGGIWFSDGTQIKMPQEHPNLTETKPLDPFFYENGRFVSPDTATFSSDLMWGVPDWKSIPGSFRNNYAGQKLLCSDKPGAELKLEFEGKAIGAFVLAGPDAGALDYEIDGKKSGKTVLFHKFSGGLHYPRTVMFDDQLSDGKHTLRLKLSAETPNGSNGTAARILQFVAN